MRTYNTFNGWKMQGRVVEYGSRSNTRNEYGDKMFHVSQTVPRGSDFYPYPAPRPRVRYVPVYY